MVKLYLKRLMIIMLLFSAQHLIAQNEPILFEAETGTLGADYVEHVDGGLTYITCTSNGVEQYPENEKRIVSYSIAFPKAGEYDLFARVRVGAEGANDDSFFYGNGFGEKNLTDADSWITINSINSGGYTNKDEVVDGEGVIGSDIWKWINLSECSKYESPTTFVVPDDELTQLIQIGSREDGLDFDKFAFGLSDLFFTVSNIENGTEGSSTKPTVEEPKPLAEDKSKFLGNVYSYRQAPGFANYWNQVTPENGGKWGSVERTRDVMNWSDLDAAYKLAKDNDFPFKLHVLVWGNQQPGWISSLSGNEQYDEIEEWFYAVANRYPDIDFIEVVNEPFNDPPDDAEDGGYMNALGGTGQTGYDWIIEAFRMARNIFPNSKLMMNEYNVINNGSTISKYIQVVNLLKSEDLIDAIGFQAHAFSTGGSATTMKTNLNRLATLELPIYITEMDVDGPTDQKQLDDYKRIFPVFWEHPSVKGITLWGYRTGLWRANANLINTDGTERPALEWLRDYVAGTFVSVNDLKISPDIVVYPNPVTSKMVTFTGIQTISSIRLFDLSGKQIKQQSNFDEERIIFNMDVRPGVYVLQFTDEKSSYFRKVVVN